jgi:hypothetical protein
MKTNHFSLLLISLATIPYASLLGDSTDDALNQFYVENMANRLTSEVPAASASSPPQSEEKADQGASKKSRRSVRPTKPANSLATRTSSSLFSYRSSAGVTQKARLNFTAAVAKGDPQKTSVLQKEFSSNPEARFDARFSRYGFSSHNMADSYTGLLIVLWEIVNNQDASAHPEGIRQVRAKVNGLLLSKVGGRTFPDASKQYFSEYLKLLAVIYSDIWKKQLSANNSAAVQNVQNTAYQSSLKLGIDFKKLELTDAGFAKR